jgi:hypothetical protein
MQRTIGDNRSQPGKETKSRLIEIPNDFNRTLKVRVLELEERGIDTTVSELIVKYAQIGYKMEEL